MPSKGTARSARSKQSVSLGYCQSERAISSRIFPLERSNPQALDRNTTVTCRGFNLILCATGWDHWTVRAGSKMQRVSGDRENTIEVRIGLGGSELKSVICSWLCYGAAIESLCGQ